MRKGERRSRSCRRRTSAKREAPGWEACTAVVARFICIIVQAGLWVLQGCFVCHSPQPWGYQGLAFPMINIQRFTSRAKACCLDLDLYILIYTLFYIYLCIFFSLCSLHHLSTCFLSACGGAIFDRRFVIHHACLFVQPSGVTGLQRNADV